MEQDSFKQISSLVQGRLPEFVRVDHPTLVAFLAAYYEWLQIKDREGKIMSPMMLQDVIDIDASMDEFLTQFKKEYLYNFPEQLAISKSTGKPVDSRKLMKNIKSFYRAKGTEKSFEFLFQILYNAAVEFYYPKKDVLRASDGKWYEKNSLKVSSSLGDRIFESVGRIVYQRDSSGKITSSAKVVDVSLYQQGPYEVAELTISGRNGSFSPGSRGISFDTDTETLHELRVYTVVGSVSITNGGSGYVVGDKVVFTAASGDSGEGAIGTVSLVTSTGSIRRIRMENFGINYLRTPQVTVQSLSGSGFSGTAITSPLCLSEGYYLNSDGRLDTSKVLQDNHYYQDYSYVLKSEIVVDEYRETLRRLVHPAGTAMFGQILIKRCSHANLANSSALIRYEVPIIGHYIPYTFNTFDNLKDWFTISGTGASGGTVIPVGYDPNLHDRLIKAGMFPALPVEKTTIGNPITNLISFVNATGPSYAPLGQTGFQNADPFWIVYEHPNRKIQGPVIAQIWRSQLSDFVGWNEWCSVTGGGHSAGWVDDFSNDPSLEKKYAFLNYDHDSAFRKITARSFFEMPIGTEFDCRVESNDSYALPRLIITNPKNGKTMDTTVSRTSPLNLSWQVRNFENSARLGGVKFRITLNGRDVAYTQDLNARSYGIISIPFGVHRLRVEMINSANRMIENIYDEILFSYGKTTTTPNDTTMNGAGAVADGGGVVDGGNGGGTGGATGTSGKGVETGTNNTSDGNTTDPIGGDNGDNPDVPDNGTNGGGGRGGATGPAFTGFDFNGDGKIDAADLGMLLGAWGTSNAKFDSNGDGKVDGGDLGAFFGSWTPPRGGTDGGKPGDIFRGFDFNGDGKIDSADLGMLLGAWGTSNPKFDSNGDGKVDGADIGAFFGAYQNSQNSGGVIFRGFDFNNDGKVDGADLALLLTAWGTSDPIYDSNGDGIVDGADLAAFLGDWNGNVSGTSVFTGFDFNEDGKIDGADLGLFLSQWGTANPRFDSNGDGKVDGGDLGAFLGVWTPPQNGTDNGNPTDTFKGWDFNGDGKIDAADLGLLLGAWGTSNPKYDFNADGKIDGQDLGAFFGAFANSLSWGGKTFHGFDFNRDGKIDGADMALLMGAWGTSNPEFDSNGDGIVDGADLAAFLAVWGDPNSGGSGLRYDFNNDGKVDGSDLAELLTAVGSTDPADLAKYDLNGDGMIDGADIKLFKDFWEQKPFHSLDFNGDGIVDAADLAELLTAIGSTDPADLAKYDLNNDNVINSLDVDLFNKGWTKEPYNTYDFNGDGNVDGSDLAELLTAIGSTDPDDLKKYDLNNDGKIDGADVAIFQRQWIKPYQKYDFNQDGVVDGADLAELLTAVGSTDPDDLAKYDLNGDGKIDSTDIAIFNKAQSNAPNSNYDFNGDGAIDGADLAQMLTYIGSTDPDDLAKYDLNGDGKIDGADVTIFQNKWNNSTSVNIDFNGDGKVDGADLAELLTVIGSTDPADILKYDLNKDGVIDNDDVLIFQKAWNGSQPPFIDYDFNHDGKIDGQDLALLLLAVGTTDPGLIKIYDLNQDGKVDSADVRLFQDKWSNGNGQTGEFIGFDFNGDGKIDAADQALLMAAMGTPDLRFDANGDGKVDSADLALFLAAWGGGTDGRKFDGFDFNKDGVVDGADFAELMINIGTNDPYYDANGDGIVDQLDVDLFKLVWNGTSGGGTNPPTEATVFFDEIAKTRDPVLDAQYEAAFANLGVKKYKFVYGGSVTNDNKAVVNFSPGNQTINKDILVRFIHENLGIQPNSPTVEYIAVDFENDYDSGIASGAYYDPDYSVWKVLPDENWPSAPGPDTQFNGPIATDCTNKIKDALDYCRQIFGPNIKFCHWGYPNVPNYHYKGWESSPPHGAGSITPRWSAGQVDQTDWMHAPQAGKDARIAFATRQFAPVVNAMDFALTFAYAGNPMRSSVESGLIPKNPNTDSTSGLGVLRDYEFWFNGDVERRLAAIETTNRIRTINQQKDLKILPSISAWYFSTEYYAGDVRLQSIAIPHYENIDFVRRIKASGKKIDGVSIWTAASYHIDVITFGFDVNSPINNTPQEWAAHIAYLSQKDANGKYFRIPPWFEAEQPEEKRLADYIVRFTKEQTDAYLFQQGERDTFIRQYYGGVSPIPSRFSGWNDPAFRKDGVIRWNNAWLDTLSQMKSIITA
jgi:Ca2+-binding EF-hand superfamily protein